MLFRMIPRGTRLVAVQCPRFIGITPSLSSLATVRISSLQQQGFCNARDRDLLLAVHNIQWPSLLLGTTSSRCCCRWNTGSIPHRSVALSDRGKKDTNSDKADKGVGVTSLDDILFLIRISEVVSYLQRCAQLREKALTTKIRDEEQAAILSKAPAAGEKNGDNLREGLLVIQQKVNERMKKTSQEILEATLTEYGLDMALFLEMKALREKRHAVVHPKTGHAEAVETLKLLKKLKAKEGKEPE